MKRRFVVRAAVAATGALALAAGTAGAHPMDFGTTGDSWINSGVGVHWKSHGAAGAVAGRQSVPAQQYGLELVGKSDLGGKLAGAGRVADVSAKGNYAYLTMFYEPTCGRGGVQIVDIANPAAPKMLGYIPSHTDTYSGEGSQVIEMNTPSFKGDLLVYQNEWCPNTTNGVGGITLVDVRNPNSPKKLVEGAGDFTKRDGTQSKGVPQTKANQTHSAFAWKQKDASGRETGKVFVVLVDDLEEPDVDIMDITNPAKPKMVSETNLDQFAQSGPGRPHGDSVFSHDMIVKHIGGRDVMLMSYWDGGYVTLDVTNPAAPVALSDTDFAAADPARAERGETITPEGNGHQAEFTRDNKFFFATDEDFNPYRVQATFKGGAANGQTFTAIQASGTKPVNKDNPLAGDTQFTGLACDPLPAGSGTGKIAVAERGTCDFQVKLDNAIAAGYKGLIVFNRRGTDGCETLVNMLAASDTTPAIFVSRQDGFRLLGVEPGPDYTCGSASETDGTNTPAGPSVPVDISAVFDGWGYTHMYKTDLTPGAKMQEVDFYAPEEGQNVNFAENFGDMTVHEVATDPDKNLVYVSHYALGMRALSYNDSGLTEVGAFVEAGGSNYWGVEVHKMNGKTYILGSDRDRGLRIFTFGG
ncbi:MAG TPA: PA domain-containing protein [Solirubrobacteraceae bacterium]|nr:PA domain-containing protein [Solirubrobacteraceae bacterium]